MPTGIPEAQERKLIHIPIIHTLADMGGLADSVKRASVEKLGRRKWKHNLGQVDRMWGEIETAVENLGVTWGHARVYQDGLPVCGREMEIVADLAGSGSRNHQLLLRLKEWGATIMGTESPELLLEEYGLVKQFLITGRSQRRPPLGPKRKELSASLLRKRDQYIAGRIHQTLCPGEAGILFLGALHSVEEFLDAEISVSHPLGQAQHPEGRRT